MSTATFSRRQILAALAAAGFAGPAFSQTPAIRRNMIWRWGDGREVYSDDSFTAVQQYLWGTRSWTDVFRGILTVAVAVAAQRPELLAGAISGPVNPDPVGAKNRLRDGHGSDSGAKREYDRYYDEVGPDRFFRTFVTAAERTPNWTEVEGNIRWTCENNPMSCVSAFQLYERDHSSDRSVTTAMFFLLRGQLHNDGGRRTFREAAAADLPRLFETILTQNIQSTNAVARAEAEARRRMEDREPHPGPGRPDPAL